MRPHKRFIIASVVAVALLGFFLLWLTSPGPGINRQGFDRIRIGMDEAEVVSVVQATPGDYITGKMYVAGGSALSAVPMIIPIDDFRRNRELSGAIPGVKEWYGDQGIILVRFGTDGRVDGKSFRQVLPEQESFLNRVRRWLGG